MHDYRFCEQFLIIFKYVGLAIILALSLLFLKPTIGWICDKIKRMTTDYE
jgi:hypothetical protein